MLKSTLTAREKLTLIALLDHWPDCRPSLVRLAAYTSTSRRRVIDQLQALAHRGIISIERRPNTSNRYHLQPGWENHVPEGVTLATDAPSSDVASPPEPPEVVTQCHLPSDAASPPQGRSVTPLVTQCHLPSDTASPKDLKRRSQRSKQVKVLRSARNEPASSSPDSKQLWEVYFQAYERVRGQKPVFDKSEASRAGKAFNDLLSKAQGLDPAKRVITNAFSDEWTAANRCQPWEILADVNKHAGNKPRPRKAHQEPRQPNHPGARMLQPREA